MRAFPKIDSPCPYKNSLSEILDGDFCRMCERSVVDLTAWSEDERRAFLKACSGEVCVSYKLPVRRLAAAALAVAAFTAPAAAQDAVPADVQVTDAQAVAVDDLPVPEEDMMIIVGGIKDPASTASADEEDAKVPELPIVYEDEKSAADLNDQELAAAVLPREA